MALLCEITRFASTAITKHIQICSRMALVPCQPLCMRNGTPNSCIRSKCYTLDGNGLKKDKTKKSKTRSRVSPNSSQLPQHFANSFKSNGKIFHIDISKLNNIIQQTSKTLQNLKSAHHQSLEGHAHVTKKINLAQHAVKPASTVKKSSGQQRPVAREKESAESAGNWANKEGSIKKTNLTKPTPVKPVSQTTNAESKTAAKPLKSKNRPSKLEEAIDELNRSASRNTKAGDILEIKPTVVEVIRGTSKNVSGQTEELIVGETNALQKEKGVIRGANFILVDQNSSNAPLRSLNASKLVNRRNIDSGPVLTDSTDHVAYGDRNTFILVDSVEKQMARRYGKDRNNFVIHNDNPHVVIKPNGNSASQNSFTHASDKSETKHDGVKAKTTNSVQTKDVNAMTKGAQAEPKNTQKINDVTQTCYPHDPVSVKLEMSANTKELVGHRTKKAVSKTKTPKAQEATPVKNEKNFFTTVDETPMTSFECVIRDSQKLIEKIEEDKLKERMETFHLEGNQSTQRNASASSVSDKALLSKESSASNVSKVTPSKESIVNNANKSMSSRVSGATDSANYTLPSELSARPKVMGDRNIGALTEKAPKIPKASVKELKPDLKRAKSTENDHTADTLRKKEDREPPLYVRPEELNKRTFPQPHKVDSGTNPETLNKSCGEPTDLDMWSSMLLKKIVDYQELIDKPIRAVNNTRANLVQNASDVSKTTLMNRFTTSPNTITKNGEDETANSKLSKGIAELRKMPSFDLNNLNRTEDLRKGIQDQWSNELKNQPGNQKTLGFNCTETYNIITDKNKVKNRDIHANSIRKNKSDTGLTTLEGSKNEAVNKSGSSSSANLSMGERKKSYSENTGKKNKKLRDSYSIEPASKWTKLRQAIFKEDSAQPKFADKQIKVSSNRSVKDVHSRTGHSYVSTQAESKNRSTQKPCPVDKVLPTSHSKNPKATPQVSQQPIAGSSTQNKAVDKEIAVAYKELKSKVVTKTNGPPDGPILPRQRCTVGDLNEGQAPGNKAEKDLSLAAKQRTGKDELAVKKSSSNFDLKSDQPMGAKSVRSLSDVRRQELPGVLRKKEKVIADIQLDYVDPSDGADITGANQALRKFQSKLERQKKLIDSYEKNLMKYELALERYRSLLTPPQKSTYERFREDNKSLNFHSLIL
ncbi:hypothetical protein Btru_035073 [Bulinus truncatus]|nr:hypothetical protein Btru_035073 [Bulinus truncatus]